MKRANVFFKRAAAWFAALCLMLPAAALGEGTETPETPSTPTDLECGHENTKEIIYFFDSPMYTALGNGSHHRVEGPAVVETVCESCGEVIASETVEHAEEIRPHTMRNNVCLLCGYKRKADDAAPTAAPAQIPEDVPGEKTFFVEPEKGLEEEGIHLSLTLEDFRALKRENINTVVIRRQDGRAGVALPLAEILEEAEGEGADVQVQIQDWQEGPMTLGVALIAGADTWEPETDKILLRLYLPEASGLTVIRTGGDGEVSEADARWEAPAAQGAEGYWTLPYLGAGEYETADL